MIVIVFRFIFSFSQCYLLKTTVHHSHVMKLQKYLFYLFNENLINVLLRKCFLKEQMRTKYCPTHLILFKNSVNVNNYKFRIEDKKRCTLFVDTFYSHNQSVEMFTQNNGTDSSFTITHGGRSCGTHQVRAFECEVKVRDTFRTIKFI